MSYFVNHVWQRSPLYRRHCDMVEGRLVNIERSYRVGDEIGGHVLSGHVYGQGRVSQLEKTDENHEIEITCPADWMKFILPKGFIALDGVSLTICECFEDGRFTVNLIPETLRITTFGFKKTGDLINIELDHQTQTIVTTVERILHDINQ